MERARAGRVGDVEDHEAARVLDQHERWRVGLDVDVAVAEAGDAEVAAQRAAQREAVGAGVDPRQSGLERDGLDVGERDLGAVDEALDGEAAVRDRDLRRFRLEVEQDADRAGDERDDGEQSDRPASARSA